MQTASAGCDGGWATRLRPHEPSDHLSQLAGLLGFDTHVAANAQQLAPGAGVAAHPNDAHLATRWPTAQGVNEGRELLLRVTIYVHDDCFVCAVGYRQRT